MDIETLDAALTITKTKSGKRPDYLGRSVLDKWFTFESKGRSSSPGPADLKKWKEQVRTIRKVNNNPVTQGIVSATYLNACQEWELL